MLLESVWADILLKKPNYIVIAIENSRWVAVVKCASKSGNELNLTGDRNEKL